MSDTIILNDKEVSQEELLEIQKECKNTKEKKLIELSENTYKVLIKMED